MQALWSAAAMAVLRPWSSAQPAPQKLEQWPVLVPTPLPSS
eukprot:CAMPEP_0196653786 /NCGR_PEP_ID=MMETSP1086-20130531/3445_1 /TAXON_ID=77921 /ORGANISM="Cyanoptyche  gloeocystis , Strain SAG4.97" /LENGTH=40 /DNA_ID= /DNA_START= /DNA_END= /DNA_ORIENTATION=